MANINQIQVGSTVYDIEDQTARSSISNLAAVASSGDYGDLDNTPTIPSVAKYTATIAAAGWTGSGPYTNSVTVNGLLTTDTPTMDLVASSTYATAESEIADYAYIYKATCAANTLTVYATQAPSVGLNIQLICVR